MGIDHPNTLFTQQSLQKMPGGEVGTEDDDAASATHLEQHLGTEIGHGREPPAAPTAAGAGARTDAASGTTTTTTTTGGGGGGDSVDGDGTENAELDGSTGYLGDDILDGEGEEEDLVGEQGDFET